MGFDKLELKGWERLREAFRVAFDGRPLRGLLRLSGGGWGFETDPYSDPRSA